MARQVLENGVILPAEYSDDWYDDMTSNLTKLDDVIGSDSEKLSSTDVGAAALSNNYNDLDNLPTIPTVNDAVLTIQKNGVDVQTFTANASSNVTANITVPTKTSDLTNDSDFVDISNPAVSSGITSAKVSDYDTHIADTDIHVTTADKATWNTVTSKANDSDVVHKSGDETVGGVKTFANTPMFASFDAIRFRCAHNSNAYITFRNTNQANPGSLILSAHDGNAGTVIHLVDKTLIPYNTNDIDLGTASKKWKSFNGLNPGALSMPSGNTSDMIDISSYITLFDGTNNGYTPPADGWICISGKNCTAIYVYRNNYWGVNSFSPTADTILVAVPVVAGVTFAIKVIGQGLNYAKFVPCQGNV